MTKISALTDELVTPDTAVDWLVIVDTSDLTMSPEGTNKRVNIETIVAGSQPVNAGLSQLAAIFDAGPAPGLVSWSGIEFQVSDITLLFDASDVNGWGDLPTTDPGVANQLWVNPANQFAVTVSQGP